MKPLRRPTREDELFGDLRRAVLKPQPREQHRNAMYLPCALAVPPLSSPIAHVRRSLPHLLFLGRKCAMVRGGKAVRSRTDYILGTDRSLFKNVVVRDPRYNSDHYMVMGLLRGGTAKAHDKYIVGIRKVPMQPLRRPTQEDELFGDLRRAVLKPQPREQHRNAWIPKEFFLPRWPPQWLHWDLPPSHDVLVMRLRRPAPKESHNHVVIRVIARVPDGHIPKETAVSP